MDRELIFLFSSAGATDYFFCTNRCDFSIHLGNWLHGDIRHHDITDTKIPKLVGQVRTLLI